MICLLWISLILLPVLIGNGILALFYGKNTTYDITVSESCVLGFIACIGVSEVIHAAGYLLGWSLRKCTGLWGLALLAVSAVAVLLFVFLLRGHFRERIALCKGYKFDKTVVPFVFLGVVLLQMLFIFCTLPIFTVGDITLETVQSFLAEDGIYRVLPLTGQVSEQGVPLRYGILCLPTVYAMLSTIFGIEAQLLVCHVIPVAILGISYMSHYYLSGVLFGEKAYGKRFMFLLAVSLIFLFTDTGIFSNGYGILHSGYLGTAIRNLILVPYLFGATLEKRWWKAVLCILAEACINWTLWGMGICVVILIGMLLLSIAEQKCPRLRNCLQIFREKEDLT